MCHVIKISFSFPANDAVIHGDGVQYKLDSNLPH